jgi:hypothetical protein
VPKQKHYIEISEIGVKEKGTVTHTLDQTINHLVTLFNFLFCRFKTRLKKQMLTGARKTIPTPRLL